MSPAVKRVSESGTIQACSSRFRSLLHSPCLSHSCHNGYREQGGFCVKRTTLRSVALRAPYMHNASIATLAEPVRHYETGGIDRPSRSLMLLPIQLTDLERLDLVAFMETLNGDGESPRPSR